IYGSRGSNGVIVITTKSGRKGRSSLKFTSEMGAGYLAFDKFDMMNAQEHVNYYARALYNAGTVPTLDAGYNLAISPSIFNWDGTTDTDWFGAVKRNSPSFQRYGLNYSGGVGNFSVYSSLGYMQQEGLSSDSDFHRYNGMLKGIWKANDKLSMNFSINLSQTKQEGPADASSFSNPMFAGRIMSPTQSVFNPDGSYNLNLYFLNPNFNPVAIQNANIQEGEFSKVLASIGMDYEFVKGLRYNSVFGLDRTTSEETIFWNPDFGDGINAGDSNGNGNLFKTYGLRNTWNWYNFLHYNKVFADKHDVTLSAGMEATRRETFYDSVGAQGVDPGERRPFLSVFRNPVDMSNTISKNGLVGYIGRASYTFDRFVTLTGSFRRDGYSGFTDFYGNFFGAGLAVDLGKTSLMPSQFRTLKLRGSYGENGNTTVGPYSK